MSQKDKCDQIRNRINIDERPKIVLQKSHLGDWNIDTVMDKNYQGALVTIVDRASKFTLIKKVDSKQVDSHYYTTKDFAKNIS